MKSFSGETIGWQRKQIAFWPGLRQAMDSLNTDEILQKLLITIALDLHGRKNSLAAYLKSNEIVFISASSMKVGGATLYTNDQKHQ